MTGPSNPEDARLLFRARIVTIGVVLFLLSLITTAAVVGPLLNVDYRPSEALLIVMVPSLVGVLLPLIGIRTILNRRD